MRRPTLLATLLLLLAPAAPADAAACDRVAAPSGSDSAAGTESAPFRTAQKVVDEVRPGQTGCLRGGTYTNAADGEYVMRFSRGGRAGERITIRSYPGERALLKGTVYLPEEAPHVTLAAMDFVGTGRMNAVKVYTSDFILEDSSVTTAGRPYSCLMMSAGDRTDAPAARPIIRRNTFRECGSTRGGSNKDHAIYAAQVRDGVIEDNLIVRPAAYAIQLYPAAKRTHVARNVVDGGGSNRGGIVVGGEDDRVSTANVIEHNVLAFAAWHGVTTYWPERVGAANVVRENCIWQADSGMFREKSGLQTSGNIEADPGFADRAAGDYRLSPDSRCASLVGGARAGAPSAPMAAPKKPAATCRKRRSTRRTRRCRRAARPS